MIAGFSIILTCLVLGEAVSEFFHLPVPGPVIAMMLLTTSLVCGLVRLEQVKTAADGLLKHLALFFVPPGVGLLLYGESLKDAWLSLGVSLTISTVAVLGVVGLIQQYLEERHG
ncbi:CidA/LrgA family protein [candidate division KSB3 bacterium]|uniref:CidA/LrgA family protein n=1 Tax=candidate division KSB3 bacterium TaxID=2044937 RepID=A0A2G6E1U6_9BACT|nr:MAG: CidA/LrgA family protein [candidate division KSB3 bacterium]PIE28536.1 MAG: CidA/LrgA family protein [candidate division KSB3 bacterium]